MNEDILKGKWKEIKGEVKQKWGKLTDDDTSGRKRRRTHGAFAEEVWIRQGKSRRGIQGVHRPLSEAPFR